MAAVFAFRGGLEELQNQACSQEQVDREQQIEEELRLVQRKQEVSKITQGIKAGKEQTVLLEQAA